MKRLIITLTPFPSIAYIYGIEELVPHKMLPSKSVSLNILSKGIYSAQIMKVLQEEPMVISSFGGFGGKSIKHYLDKSKIKSDIVWTDYETPHQVHILSQKDMSDYTLQSNEDFHIDKEMSKLTYKLNQHIKKVSTLVLSGYLPEHQDPKVYSQWITLAKQHNVKTVISTGQQKVWENVIEAKPYAILLTEEQLKALGYCYDNEQAIIDALYPLLGNDLHYICVYLKNSGALIISKSKCCQVQSSFHLLNVNNTASSGAFLGALAIGINRRYEQEKIAKLCLAAALAANDNVMHNICTRKEIEYRYKKTKVKDIDYSQ